MKWFPEKEKRKKYMKFGLPAVFTIAWTPVVWTVVAALLGPPMERVFSSWQPVVAVLSVATLLVMTLLLRVVRTAGLKFNEKGAE